MPAQEEPPAVQNSPKPPRRPRRLRRAFLILLVLALIFHRPLFHQGVRIALIQVAARQNLTLDVQFSGNIFTNLTVENVRARPNGRAFTPVERIDIERVDFEYSIPMLIRHGFGEFLRKYRIQNAELVFNAHRRPGVGPRKPRIRKRSLAEDLNNLLAQPAGYADFVQIENFNLVIHGPAGDLAVKGADLRLDPEKMGHLRIRELKFPRVPGWQNLSAETSYTGRNFHIHRMVLAPELILEDANFDASQRAQNRGSMMLKASVFGGTAEISLYGTKLRKRGENLSKSYDTTLKIEGRDISMERALAYFNGKKSPVGVIRNFSLQVTGEPEKPIAWTGGAEARVERVTFGKFVVESMESKGRFKNGLVEFEGSKALIGRNQLLATGTGRLPESVNDLKKSVAEAAMVLDAPDLAAVTAGFPKPLSGNASGEGTFQLRDERISTDFNLRFKNVVNEETAIASATLHLTGSKALVSPKERPLETLQSHVVADLKELRFRTFKADTAHVDIQMIDDLANLRGLDLVRGENRVTARGSYRVPVKKQGVAGAPLNGEFTIHAPKLETFGFAIRDQVLGGQLNGTGALHLVNQNLNGTLKLDGSAFQVGEFKADRIAIDAGAANNQVELKQFHLQLNASDRIALLGKFGLKRPLVYEGGAIVSVRDLSIFEPLLRVFGRKEEIKGNLQVDWNGKNDLINGTANPSGNFDIQLTKGAFGKIDLSEVKLVGTYDPELARASEFRIQSGATSLEGDLEIKDGKLRFRDISLQQGRMTVLTGFLFLPMDLGNPKELIPLDQRIAANLNAKDLDLESLAKSFGREIPGRGSVTASLLSGGTLLEPTAHLKIAGRKLQGKMKTAIDPAELDVTAHYSKKEFTIDATLRQPQMQGISLKGHAPFDLAATIKTKKLDPDLPLDFDLQLTPSALALVPKLFPAIRRIEGTAGASVHLSGTVGKPKLSGSAMARIQSARLINEGVPAIGGFQADLDFANDTVTLKTFRGEIGGGTFDLGGVIRLPKVTEPVFDLRLRSKDVLVQRNDSVTVRIDTDLKLIGPLNSAAATGEVFVTNSRFFREIDILPIGLPGRPKPKPRSAPSSKTLSFAKPPMRDWKFDISIKTRPDDPFRIRGNMANGGANLDLKFVGTGLKPYLSGTAAVENFEASLPFSKLTVTRGYLYFTPEAPFEPTLDIMGESVLRDYRVFVYIYGRTGDPQVSLTSEPPLPQADIVSLLAMGTTTAELTGSSDVLAGRAAVLVFQQLYRKVFKRRESTEQQSVRDRFEFDIGAVDSRTGRQEISARFKLGEQFYLIGDLDVAGTFTGRLRYLLRFR